jgi:hypothetical protein
MTRRVSSRVEGCAVRQGRASRAVNTFLRICTTYAPSLRPVFEEFACLLDAGAVFDGLADAERVATVMAVIVCGADEPAYQLRELADGELDERVARAYSLAAEAW